MVQTRPKPITELRALALRQGFLTEDQILDRVSTVGDVAIQVDLMDDAYALMRELSLEIFESEEEARRRVKQVRAAEDSRAPSKPLTVQAIRYDDPVRMYLREMGRVPLLNREGEVRIAKRIEAAEERIQSTMFLLPWAVRDLQLTAEKLKENKAKLDDLVQIDVGSWTADFSSKKERRRVIQIVTRIGKRQGEFIKYEQQLARRLSERKRKQVETQREKVSLKLGEEIKKLNTSPKLVERISLRLRKEEVRLHEAESEVRDLEARLQEVQAAIAALEESAGKKTRRKTAKTTRSRKKAAAAGPLAKLHEQQEPLVKSLRNARRKLRRIEAEAGMRGERVHEFIRLLRGVETERTQAKKEMIEANVRLVISIAKQVRLPQGLQVLDLCDLVDPSGDHPRDCRPGTHHPRAGAHDRSDQQGGAHIAQAGARPRARAVAGRDRGKTRAGAGEGQECAQGRPGTDQSRSPHWRGRRFQSGGFHRGYVGRLAGALGHLCDAARRGQPGSRHADQA